MRVEGSCLCGGVEFTAEVEPQRVFVCHCASCQAHSAKDFRTVAMVSEDDFCLARGQLEAWVEVAGSGAERRHEFCAECGTQILGTHTGPGPRTLGLRVGALKQRDQLQPVAQVWHDASLPWLEKLPVMPATRPLKPEGD